MNALKVIESMLFTSDVNRTIYQNLSVPALIEKAVLNKEGRLTSKGAFHAYTGEFTGRSPKDKYIVSEPSTRASINWGPVNQPISQEAFDQLYQKALDYMSEHDLYVFDGYAGADSNYQVSIKVINELAWQNLFIRQLLIRKPEVSEQENPMKESDYTIICLPGLKANPKTDGTHSETFILLSLEKRIVLIGGTHYAGEMKKAVFSLLNYMLPLKKVLPMHCSSNVGLDGDVALFFGLSGTGKTTLSADSGRHLIGDDEHGWSEDGVFNFEGGCYAKCIGLSEEKEPEIWNAIRYGSVLENVVINSETRELDFHDSSVTENTRVAYPLEAISNALPSGRAGHPKAIIFLTADAFGVLPPVSKLDRNQAMYHFLSGYTSKLAGTERGVTEPQATFSACFGEPFLPLHPKQYADLLGEKIDQHQVNVYLVNTGWTGGPYGVGKRMDLRYTRAIIAAILDGKIEDVVFRRDPIFGLAIPESISHVPIHLLSPQKTWADSNAYLQKAKELAGLFVENFNQFSEFSPEVQLAGPRLD